MNMPYIRVDEAIKKIENAPTDPDGSSTVIVRLTLLETQRLKDTYALHPEIRVITKLHPRVNPTSKSRFRVTDVVVTSVKSPVDPGTPKTIFDEDANVAQAGQYP